MRRVLAFFAAAALTLTLGGCGARTERDEGKLQVVTTLFPYYDFARAIAGERAEVTLLLSPGREAHSFEPTPLDAVTIAEADVFLYNGGEGEYWVEEMLEAVGEEIDVTARMMDYVEALEEEFAEGMQGADKHGHGHERSEAERSEAERSEAERSEAERSEAERSEAHEEHDHDGHEQEHDERDAHDEHEHEDHDSGEIEYDEHIWTSPRNAAVLCRAVCEALCEADAENADFYRANCEDYCAQLMALDARFAALCERAERRTLLFADRFPMLYFCREYGLSYHAAFHGCASDTEPSLATLKFLIDTARDEEIPVIYTIDFGTKRIAAAVSECSDAAVETMYSMQTVSREDFDAGETYLTLMERNYAALERGIGA